MLQVEGLCFSYHKKPLLQGLSFTVQPGECLVLAGPNGSGKSTLLALLAGILKPDAGRITADSRPGYMPQGTALFEDMSVDANLSFFADLAGASVPSPLPFGLEDFRRRKVSRLSGGMARRVSLCCALLGDPPVILLDEPCAGLDVRFRDELQQLVPVWKQQGRSVIYVSHDPAEFYSFYDRLMLFDGSLFPVFSKGQLSGSSGDAITEIQQLNRLYREACASVRP